MVPPCDYKETLTMPDYIELDTMFYFLSDYGARNATDREEQCDIPEVCMKTRPGAGDCCGDDSRAVTTPTTHTHTTVDKSTLHWKSWNTHTISSSIIPSEGDTPIGGGQHTTTAIEFRRLRDQLRDSSFLARHQRGLTKKHTEDLNEQNVSAIYRSQLATSLRAFQARQWAPYGWDKYAPDLNLPPRSRPGTALSESRLATRQQSNCQSAADTQTHIQKRIRPNSSPPHIQKRIRPKSSPPVHLHRVPREAVGGRYDTLTPDVVFELSQGVQPESVYGDRPESVIGRLEEIERDTLSLGETDTEEAVPPRSPSTTGSQPDQKCRLRVERYDDGVDKHASQSHGNKYTDAESDEEDYPEPAVNTISLGHLPTMQLRPEKMDALDVPVYARGDRRKYDFDHSHSDNPPYEFASVLSEAMQNLDLSPRSNKQGDITTAQPVDDTEAMIIERFLEFGKLQLKTIELEKARQEKARAIRSRQSTSRVYPMSRITSARTWREKKCCRECVQSACVGDCPDKLEVDPGTCQVCTEQDCAGTCSISVYTNHSRGEREEEVGNATLPVAPHACASCQSRHNAKLINANSLILGRPKSGRATFASGQNSHTPKDLRPQSGCSVTKDLQTEFRLLGIESVAPIEESDRKTYFPTRPWTPTGDPRRHPGRAGMMPGKSYFSQRRLSLTNRDIVFEKAKAAANKNIRSARRRRPKTAV